MKLKKELKRDTRIIMLAVIVLTIMTLSLSYSALFSVQTQSTVQEIDTGSLSVIIDNTSTPIYEDLLPTSSSKLPTSADSVAEGKYATLSFTNNGSLDAEFAITVSRDESKLPSLTTDADLLPLNYINVGVFDTLTNSWINFGTADKAQYSVALTSLTPAAGTNDVYPIINDIIKVTKNKQYRVYIWLSESTPADKIGKLIYLKLNVEYTTVKENTMASSEVAVLSN